MQNNPNNNYHLTMTQDVAIDLIDRFSHFYITENTKETWVSFSIQLFRELHEKKIPPLDIPFYINSITSTSIPKKIKALWAKGQALSGNNRSSEELIERSTEFFIRSKQDMIKLYMEMYMSYLRNQTPFPARRMLSLKKISLYLDISEKEVQSIIEKKINFYNIGGNIRVSEIDLLSFLFTCRSRGESLREEIATAWAKEEDTRKKERQPKQRRDDNPDKKFEPKTSVQKEKTPNSIKTNTMSIENKNGPSHPEQVIKSNDKKKIAKNPQTQDVPKELLKLPLSQEKKQVEAAVEVKVEEPENQQTAPEIPEESKQAVHQNDLVDKSDEPETEPSETEEAESFLLKKLCGIEEETPADEGQKFETGNNQFKEEASHPPAEFDKQDRGEV